MIFIQQQIFPSLKHSCNDFALKRYGNLTHQKGIFKNFPLKKLSAHRKLIDDFATAFQISDEENFWSFCLGLHSCLMKFGMCKLYFLSWVSWKIFVLIFVSNATFYSDFSGWGWFKIEDSWKWLKNTVRMFFHLWRTFFHLFKFPTRLYFFLFDIVSFNKKQHLHNIWYITMSFCWWLKQHHEKEKLISI